MYDFIKKVEKYYYLIILQIKFIPMADNRGSTGNNLQVLLNYALNGPDETVDERCVEAQRLMREMQQNGNFPVEHVEMVEGLVNVIGLNVEFSFRQAQQRLNRSRKVRLFWQRVGELRAEQHPDFDSMLTTFPGDAETLAERVIEAAVLEGDDEAIRLIRTFSLTPEEQNAFERQRNELNRIP